MYRIAVNPYIHPLVVNTYRNGERLGVGHTSKPTPAISLHLSLKPIFPSLPMTTCAISNPNPAIKPGTTKVLHLLTLLINPDHETGVS
jgi:hypothetical protein